MAYKDISGLQKGNLLFRCGNSRELIDVSGKSDWKFDHVAIVVDKNTVIEAIPRYGVILTRMDEFVKGGTVFTARVRDDKLAEKSVDVALEFLKFPYNYTFEDSISRGLYCSQLVTKSFEIANCGIPYFKEDSLNFKNKKGELTEYWINYYKRFNMKVPQGEKGSHPSRLYGDSKIIDRNVLSIKVVVDNCKERINILEKRFIKCNVLEFSNN